MSKFYVSEEQLRSIFDSQFTHETREEFEEWVDTKMEEGEIELVEFNHYEVSKLDYKPVAKLIGANGNIFNLMGIAGKVLIEAGKEEREKEMRKRITKYATSYDEALLIIMEYVEVE